MSSYSHLNGMPQSFSSNNKSLSKKHPKISINKMEPTKVKYYIKGGETTSINNFALANTNSNNIEINNELKNKKKILIKKNYSNLSSNNVVNSKPFKIHHLDSKNINLHTDINANPKNNNSSFLSGVYTKSVSPHYAKVKLTRMQPDSIDQKPTRPNSNLKLGRNPIKHFDLDSSNNNKNEVLIIQKLKPIPKKTDSTSDNSIQIPKKTLNNKDKTHIFQQSIKVTNTASNKPVNIDERKLSILDIPSNPMHEHMYPSNNNNKVLYDANLINFGRSNPYNNQNDYSNSSFISEIKITTKKEKSISLLKYRQKNR